MFRKADVKKDSVPGINQKTEEQVRPGLIKLLGLGTEEECASIRINVEHLLREQGKLLR